MMFVYAVSWLLLSVFISTRADNFPSLIMANASIAIVIDREYVGEEYDIIKSEIESYFVYAKREILKHGGINTFYFSWTAINVKKDFSAVLSVASCPDTWRLFHLAEVEDIFHMAISESDCPRLPIEKAITIPLIENGKELPQIILDLKNSEILNWKSAVIIYDETVDRDMRTEVVKSITQRNYYNIKSTAISMIKLPRRVSRNDIRSILSAINPRTVGKNYMAIVSYDLVSIIMEQAKNLNLVGTEFQWMYLISDTNHKFMDMIPFKKLLKEGDNIAFVYNTTKSVDTCVIGRKCHIEELIRAFSKALDAAIIDEYESAGQVSEEEWEAIRPTKINRRDSLLHEVKDYIRREGNCSNCTQWEVQTGDTWGGEYQHLRDKSAMDLLYAGYWRPTDGPRMVDELFIHIAHGFRGKNLPLVSFHNPPWQILKINNSGAVTEYNGLVFDIIKTLAKNLNFTFSVEVVNRTTEFNKMSVNDTLVNDNYLTNDVPKMLLKRIKSKSVAMGACAVTITDEMKHDINYTNPISTQTYTMIVARPRELSRALLFTSPFTTGTWFCLAVAIVFMGPFLYYIHRYSPVYEFKGIPKKGGLSSIQNCIWYMYGALLQQGGMHLPYADSARIIVGAWWLVVLIVATTYCGNLVAFLTFPKIDIPITSIDDLIEHRDTVTWSFPQGSFLENELRDSSEPRFKTIYDRRAQRNVVDDFIDEIKQGKHVFIDWKMKLAYIMKKQFLQTGHCDFVLGLDEICDEQLALIIPQDTPYLTKINEEIKKLHQVGLITKWLNDYLPKRDRCWKNRHIIEINNHTVNLDDMQGIFFVLFFGFVLALMQLILEKIFNRYFQRKKENTVKPFSK